MPRVNDIVQITGSISVPEEYKGFFARVTAVSGNKVNIQIKEKINGTQGVSYTAYIDDLQKVGELVF
jgi:hypothetical protein